MRVDNMRPAWVNDQPAVSEAKTDLVEDDIPGPRIFFRYLARKPLNPPYIALFLLVKKKLRRVMVKFELINESSFDHHAFQECSTVNSCTFNLCMVVKRCADKFARYLIDALALFIGHVFPISVNASAIADFMMRAAAACVLLAFPSMA